MTQAKLAERADLSVDLISRIERGDRAPSLESLEKIAEALGIDPGELLNFKAEGIKGIGPRTTISLELWNLLRNQRRDKVKKIHDIASII